MSKGFSGIQQMQWREHLVPSRMLVSFCRLLAAGALLVGCFLLGTLTSLGSSDVALLASVRKLSLPEPNLTAAVAAASATRAADNWCLDGWKAETSDRAADLSKASSCGGGGDLSCTPFWIKPYTYSKECGGGAPLAGSESASAQGAMGNRKWQYPGADDYWIFHACDGAGIQSADCNGDIYYAEHIGKATDTYACRYPDGTPSQEKCDYSDNAWGCQHNSCTHWHAGLDEINSFYQCGWWGYGPQVSPDGWYATGNEGWHGLGYEADLGGGWKGAIVATYDWVCHYQDPHQQGGGTDPSGTWHPYSAFPGGLNAAFTGKDDLRCYCDNEPWDYDEAGKKKAPPGARLYQVKYYCPDDAYCNTDSLWVMQIRGEGTCDDPTTCEFELKAV